MNYYIIWAFDSVGKPKFAQYERPLGFFHWTHDTEEALRYTEHDVKIVEKEYPHPLDTNPVRIHYSEIDDPILKVFKVHIK